MHRNPANEYRLFKRSDLEKFLKMTKHSTQSTSVLSARFRFSVVGALLSSAVSSKGHASSYVPPLSSTVIPPADSGPWDLSARIASFAFADHLGML